MFEWIRKSLKRDTMTKVVDVASVGHDVLESWAVAQDLALSRPNPALTVVDGRVAGKPWRMELGPPSRAYIHTQELRVRAELGLHEDITAMAINRPLKDVLERKAYSMITDTLQTTADPNLPEEMRWLAMYDETGWDALPTSFWQRYAVLTDRREHAMAWLDEALADVLMGWPVPAPPAETPFMVLLLRGRIYLRMEFTPAGAPTLQHVSRILTAACESALGAFEGYSPP